MTGIDMYRMTRIIDSENDWDRRVPAQAEEQFSRFQKRPNACLVIDGRALALCTEAFPRHFIEVRPPVWPPVFDPFFFQAAVAEKVSGQRVLEALFDHSRPGLRIEAVPATSSRFDHSCSQPFDHFFGL